MDQTAHRVREDLEIMRGAMGLGEPPFDRRDALRVASMALLAGPLALFGAFGPARPPYPAAAIVVTLLAALAGWWIVETKNAGDRAEHPLRWRERKAALALFLALAAALLGYLVVGFWGGLSWDLVVPTAVFVGGVAAGVPAVVEPSKRYQLIPSLVTIAYAAALPSRDDVGLVFATAAWLAAACVGTALGMLGQLRSSDPENGAG